MKDRILFASPAKTYPVDESGEYLEPPRTVTSLPALTILGSLKSEGFEADFMDLATEGKKIRTPLNKYTHRYGLPDEEVIQKISDTNPLALLITSMFSCEQQMIDDLVAKVKKTHPNLPIIAGGIHATIKPNWLLESGNIDLIIQGEGEDVIPEVLRQISLGKYPSDKVIRPRPLIQNLDRKWAFEEVLLKDDGSYRYDSLLSMRSNLYAHQASPEWIKSFMLYYSKGCPIHCDFCTATERDGSNIRHMGSERMFADLVMLREKYGVNIFYNEADAFGSHPEDINFLRKVREHRKKDRDFIINNPNGFYLKTFFPQHRGYQLDEGLLNLLKESGFNALTIAIETFNQRFNKKVNFNQITPKKIKDLISAIRERDMKTEVYLMYDFPTETLDELRYDEKMGESLCTDVLSFHTCTILPGTEYYQRGIKEGWFDDALYRKTLRKGYTFYNLVGGFNLTNIPYKELREFHLRHRLSL